MFITMKASVFLQQIKAIKRVAEEEAVKSHSWIISKKLEIEIESTGCPIMPFSIGDMGSIIYWTQKWIDAVDSTGLKGIRDSPRTKKKFEYKYFDLSDYLIHRWKSDFTQVDLFRQSRDRTDGKPKQLNADPPLPGLLNSPVNITIPVMAFITNLQQILKDAKENIHLVRDADNPDYLHEFYQNSVRSLGSTLIPTTLTTLQDLITWSRTWYDLPLLSIQQVYNHESETTKVVVEGERHADLLTYLMERSQFRMDGQNYEHSEDFAMVQPDNASSCVDPSEFELLLVRLIASSPKYVHSSTSDICKREERELTEQERDKVNLKGCCPLVPKTLGSIKFLLAWTSEFLKSSTREDSTSMSLLSVHIVNKNSLLKNPRHKMCQYIYRK